MSKGTHQALQGSSIAVGGFVDGGLGESGGRVGLRIAAPAHNILVCLIQQRPGQKSLQQGLLQIQIASGQLGR